MATTTATGVPMADASSLVPSPYVPLPTQAPVPEPDAPSDGHGSLVTQHEIDSASLLVLVGLLTLTILTTWAFKKRRVRFIHESGLSMIYGAIVGVVIRYAIGGSAAPGMGHVVTFRPEVFFYLLLPPIVFNAGYDLEPASFFGRFGPICLFAFVGTAISAVVTGFVAYLVVVSGIENLPLTLNDCLLFGSLVSATDTVTVLSVFSAAGVDPSLYALVFGESALNDAVAIALFNTVQAFEGFGQAVGIFVATFLGSVAIGVSVALVTALVTKHANLAKEPVLQSALFVVASYSTFLIGELAGLSGIVAILFCGITQAHYTKRNLCDTSRSIVGAVFEVSSFMADSFIFAYLGLSIFTYEHHEWRPAFMSFSLFGVLLARAANIFPLAALLNACTRGASPKPVPFKHMVIMWAAGLRGAVSLALAMENGETESRRIILSTTLFIVAVTVIVLGGVSLPLVTWLGVVRRRAQSIELSSVESMVNESASKAATSPSPPAPLSKQPQEDASQSAKPGWRERLASFSLRGGAGPYERLADESLPEVRGENGPSGAAYRSRVFDEYVLSSTRLGCFARAFRRLDERYLVPFFCRRVDGACAAINSNNALAAAPSSHLPAVEHDTLSPSSKGKLVDSSLSRLPIPAAAYARRRSSVAAPSPLSAECVCERTAGASAVGASFHGEFCPRRVPLDQLRESTTEFEGFAGDAIAPTFTQTHTSARFSVADAGPIVWSFGSSRSSVNACESETDAYPMPPLVWVGPPSATESTASVGVGAGVVDASRGSATPGDA